MTYSPSVTVAEALGSVPTLISNALGDRTLERCLAEAGLPLDISEKVGFYIPETALNRFLDAAARSAGDDLFGLYLSEHLSVTEYGDWGDYVLEASNLGKALERAVRIIHLHANRDMLEVRQDSGSTFFRYVFAERRNAGYRQSALAALGALLSVPRHFLGPTYRPLSIGLNLNDVSYEARIEARVGTKVRTDRDCIYLEIPTSDLTACNPAIPEMYTTIGDVVRACRGGPPENFVQYLEQLILQRLGEQHIDLDDIAHATGTSRRSLQRRIDRSGTNFRSIHTAARMRKASELLTQTSATVSAIALYLDYSTASHFSRAFRKQFGIAPLQFRNTRSVLI